MAIYAFFVFYYGSFLGYSSLSFYVNTPVTLLLSLMLLKTINPIKYKSDKIIIDEIKAIIWWDVSTNNEYEYLDKTPAIAPAARGLKIQFEMSKTILDTCSSLNRYKIVLSIVVINSANKYALNP